MVSRRNYFSIILMMAVLFFIVMFSVIIKSNGNFYDTNEYIKEELPSGANQWISSGTGELVLFLGGQDEALKNIIKQWCTYTKRDLLELEQLEENSIQQMERSPSIILLDAKELKFEEIKEQLLPFITPEVPLIFCSLPEVSQLREQEWLRQLLGISEIVEEQTKLQGIRLLDGFFLGGEAEYLAETEQEASVQDFDLTVPWYLTKAGTKVYMAGILEEEKVEHTLGVNLQEVPVTSCFPCLIWRNSYKGSNVFAVSGDYMSSLAGLGILDSFVYETRTYEIYPVVNAQNVIIHNFPNFSEENEEELMKLYSRNPRMYFQGIIWPSLSAMAKTNELNLTCMFNPQYDYKDQKLPQKEDVSFYIQQLKEIGAEAGMALSCQKDSSFELMLEQDMAFYSSLNNKYRYQVIFSGEENLEAIKENLGKEGLLNQVVTVGSPYKEGEALLSYLTEETTQQRITANAGQKHTYTNDFVVRGVQTALLYSNVLMDLHHAVWPEETSDQWQNLYKEMASNIKTYWSGYQGFEQTTLSESDYRVRTLLNLDYSHQREQDTIRLSIKQMEDTAYFLLRTHEEKIVAIKGGTFQKLEPDAYLINAQSPEVELVLESLSLKEQGKK